MSSETDPARSAVCSPTWWQLCALAALAFFPLGLLLRARLVGGEDPAQEFARQIALAQQLLDAGKGRESLVPLARAQRLRPDDFAVHNDLCVAYGLLKRRSAAVAACRRALELEPTSVLARNNLAWVLGLPADGAP